MPSTNKFAAAMRSGAAAERPREAPQEASEPKVAPTPLKAEKRVTAKPKASTRRGTKQVSGHFEPTVLRQLKQIGLDEDMTVQELLGEALDLLFQSRGRPTIARRVVDKATK